jgi:hypothetical protein
MAKKAKARSKTKPKTKAKARARVKTRKPFVAGRLNMDQAVEEAMEVVDLLCEPDVMSKPEAVEFYGRIIDRCQSSVEALEEEIENEAA